MLQQILNGITVWCCPTNAVEKISMNILNGTPLKFKIRHWLLCTSFIIKIFFLLIKKYKLLFKQDFQNYKFKITWLVLKLKFPHFMKIIILRF